MSPQEQYLAQNSLAILRDKNVRAGEDGARLENGKYPTIRASPNSQRRFLISVCSSMKGKG